MKARTFDYAEAKRLRADGASVAELAVLYGVSKSGVYYAINDAARERMLNYNAVWQEAKRVPCADGCGALVHGRYVPGRVCKECNAKRAATSVRDDALCCQRCHVWKPDGDFPRHRGESHRRYRHSVCRPCHTEIKRAYRERTRVECSHGCGRLVNSIDRDKSKPPECHPCAMERLYGRCAA